MTVHENFFSGLKEENTSGIAASLKAAGKIAVTDKIYIEEAGLAEIEVLVQLAVHAFNEHSPEQSGKIFSPEQISRVTDAYRKIYPFTSFLLCKTADEKIIGSHCTTLKCSNIVFEIEKEYDHYLMENSSSPLEQGHIFYGSLNFIDRAYLDSPGFEKGLSIRLWQKMMQITAEKITATGEGVYLSYFDKSAFELNRQVLGMPWQTIGEETKLLQQHILPCMIDSRQLKEWLNTPAISVAA